MARTAMINARTEQELKNEVEGILKSLGMSTTEAFTISRLRFRLLRQSIRLCFQRMRIQLNLA